MISVADDINICYKGKSKQCFMLHWNWSVVQTIPPGCVRPPISQLTVLVFPLMTKRAVLAGVTMYCPNCPKRTVVKG